MMDFMSFWDIFEHAINLAEPPIDVSFEEIEVVHNEPEKTVGAVN